MSCGPDSVVELPAEAALQVIYLGISGVLHPSESLFWLLRNCSVWESGHKPYEGVVLLERALRVWPAVRIVLTSTQPRSKGFENVMRELGSGIAGRVIGCTFQDLTTLARHGPRDRPMSTEDYWRCNKSELVRRHVRWLRPASWLAIDDDTILWSDEERERHFIEVDGSLGLLYDKAARRNLVRMLEHAFSAEPRRG